MKKPQFIGLDTRYRTADGQRRRRIHMDGAASPLAAETALSTIQKVLPHYSNTHSVVHSSAHICTKALAWAQETVLRFVGAEQNDYTAIFTGSGTTAGINRVARGLASSRADRNVIFVSAMEHHANDLPHRQFGHQLVYFPLTGEGETQGAVDLVALEELLQQHSEQINYIAVSAVSNVTGIINPIAEITKLAHKYGALILVDGAQAVAHLPMSLGQNDTDSDVDFFVFSGHKLYTPMSPGVLIAKKSLLSMMDGQDMGGGSVADVSYYDYQLHHEFPDREQSGTPNIVGAIALASVMQELCAYGYPQITQHDNALLDSLVLSLSASPDITVYGASDSPRAGAVAFNHRHLDHGLLAAILNDYYALALRNECFCAHPYVSSMLKQSLWELTLDDIPEDQQQAFINRKRGMVRASISLYNEQSDVDYLIASLKEISENIDNYKSMYDVRPDGSYRHKDYQLDWREYLPLV